MKWRELMTINQATTSQPEPTEIILQRANTMRADYLRSLVATAGRTIGRGWSALLSRIRSNRIMNELYALSDRELADIGLSRSDIRYLAKQIGNGHPVSAATALSNARYHGERRTEGRIPANSDRPERVSDDAENRHAA